VDCRGAEMPRLEAYLELLKGWIRNALVRRVAANVAITDHVLKRIDLPRTSRIYYGIFDAQQGDTLQLKPVSRICFAFAGRFVAEKGIPVLLDAAQILVQENLDFDVRLIGDGPLRPELEKLIREKNLQERVRITGYLSGNALAQAFADVGVVVMPSVWEETAGLSAIEQMMRGRLVIASNIGGLGEVVGDTGLRCAPGDPIDLADALRSVIVNPSLVQSMGEKARVRALQLFQQERMIEDHRRLYKRVSSQHSGSQ
jgi:glycosyltransferase involved in cell wall biosynthesis